MGVAAREASDFFEGVEPEASKPTLGVEPVVATGEKCCDVVVGPDAVWIGFEIFEQFWQSIGTCNGVQIIGQSIRYQGRLGLESWRSPPMGVKHFLDSFLQ